MIHPMIFLLLVFGLASAQFLPNGCPEDFSVHLLLPHETDCGSFYSCSNGQRILMQCAAGTLFDANIQVCNHAHAVVCQTAETTTKLPETTTEYVETTTTPIITTTTQKATTTTPNISTTTQKTTTTTPNISTTTQKITATTPISSTTNKVDEYLSNGCPLDFSIHLLLPHESDCNKFYSCSNGRKILMQCPSTLLFDSNSQHCDWPQNVDCNLPTITETTTKGNGNNTTLDLPTTTSSGTEEIITIPSTDPELTINITVQPIAVELITTLSWTSNEPVTTSPISQDPEVTTGLPSTPSICPDDFFGVKPHPELCDSYYTCTGWSPIQLFCRPGYEFDTELEKCVEIAEGGCTWAQNPTTNEITTTDATTKNTTLSEYTTAAGTGLPSTPLICPDDFFGVKPHPELCDSYYTCTGWSPIQLFCRPGYEFDPELEKCVEIAEGGCTWAQNPTTNEISTTDATTKNTTLSEYTTAASDVTTEEFTTNNTFSSKTTQEMTTKPLASATPTSAETETITEFATESIDSSKTTADSNTDFSTIAPVTEPQTTTPTLSTEEPTTFKPDTQSTIIENSTDAWDITTEKESLPTEYLTTLYLITTESLLPDLPTTVEVSTDETAFTEEDDVTLTVSTEKLTTIDSSILASTTEIWGTTTDQEVTENLEMTSERDTTQTTTEKISTDTPTTVVITDRTVITEDGPFEVTTETTLDSSTNAQTTENFGTTSNLEGSTQIETEGTTVQPEAAIVCPDDYFGNLPHPESCDAYFLCSGWDPILLFCPSSQEFDPVSGTCVVIAEGGCTWQKTSSTSIIEQTTTFSPSDVSTDAVTVDLLTTPDLITEKESTTGSWETTTSFKSTDEQTIFETTNEELTTSKPTTLAVTDTSTHEVTTDSFSTIIESQSTTKSTHASENSTTTVYNSTMIVTTETDLPTTSQETTIENLTEENDITSTPTESTTAHPEPVLICPDNFFGNLPHPERCDAYFLCSGWDPILLYCPSGNEFDPESGKCVAIAEGGCTWQNTTTTSVTEHTTTHTSPDISTDAGTEDTSTTNTQNKLTTESWETTTYKSTDEPTIFVPTTDNLSTDDNISTDTVTEDKSTTSNVITTEFWKTTTFFNSTDKQTTDEMTTEELTTSEPTTLKVTEASTNEATTENLPTNTESQRTPESESITTEINTTVDITTDKLSTDLPTTAQVTSTQTVVTEAQETTVTLEATSNYDTTSTPTESTTVQPEAVIICPDNFFGNLPHPERCDAYFLCSGWDPILLFCPSSQEFDRVSGTCVVIAEGGCTWQKTSTTSLIEQTTTYSPSDVSTDAVTVDLATTPDLITEKESTTGSWETTTSFKSTDEQTTFETITEELTSLKPTTVEVTDALTYETTTESFSTITESQTTSKATDAAESSTTTIYNSTMVTITETGLPTTSQETTIENVTEENNVTSAPTESTTVHPETALKCPDNFFGYLPHPERCDAYFLCSGWDPILLYCPSGNEFDPESDRCIVIDEGGCTWQKTNTPSVTEYTTIYASPDTSTENTTEDLSTVDANTSSESTPATLQTTLEPITDDLFTLEPTTLEVTEITTYSNSEVTTKETITESTTVFEPFTTIDEELTTLGSTMEATEATTPAICPSDFFGSVANPEECDSYYMCSGWMPIPLRCPNGYEFDPTVQSCVQIAEGGCTWNSKSTMQTTTESFSPQFTTKEMTTDNQESTTIKQETTIGEQEQTIEDQKVPTVVQETTTDEISTRKTEITLEITDTTATTANLIDDAFLPPNPGLPEAPTVLPINIVNTTPEATTEREETTFDLPATLEATTEVFEVIEEEAICPAGFFGSIPHPEKCDTYYMCSGWMPILLRCSSGFEFNPAIQSCVAIADGGCTYSQVYYVL